MIQEITILINFDEIRNQVPILEFAERLGIEGELRGQEFWSKCPLPEHEENTPSWSIATDGDKKGFWSCFGCGGKGHAIQLIQRIRNVQREDAENILSGWFGIERRIHTVSITDIQRALEITKVETEADILKIPLPRVSEWDQSATEHLCKKRKYDDETAHRLIEYFQMKWCSQGYYRDRIIIPIHNSFSEQVTFEAGAIDPLAKPKKLYPKGSEISRLLFNNNNIPGTFTWIVEGIWDAIRLWSFGEPAIATFGTSLKPSQISLIIGKYTDVILLFDGDEAGRNGRDKLAEQLKPYINVLIADLRYGDPGDLTKKEFQELVRFLR